MGGRGEENFFFLINFRHERSAQIIGARYQMQRKEKRKNASMFLIFKKKKKLVNFFSSVDNKVPAHSLTQLLKHTEKLPKFH